MPDAIPTAADVAAQQPIPVQVPPVTPPVAAQADPAEVPAVKTFLQQAEEAGFTDLKDEADAQARLLEAWRQEREVAQAAQRRAQELEELTRLRELALAAAQQQKPASPPTPQPTGADPYGALEIDEDRVQEFYDAASKGWREGTPDDVKQQFARYEANKRQRLNSFLDNPREWLSGLFDQMVDERVEKRAAALESKTEEEALRQRFIQGADWLYAKDPVTNQPRIDPRTGQYALTPEGVKFGTYMEEAEALGIATFAGQLNYAEKMRVAEIALSKQTQQSATQQAQNANAQHKQDLLNRGLQNPQRSGMFPKAGDSPAKTQNKSLSLGERTLALMQSMGSA